MSRPIPPTINVKRAALELAVTSTRVLQMIYEGKLPATRSGREWVIASSDLDAARQRMRRVPTPASQPAQPSVPIPSMREVMPVVEPVAHPPVLAVLPGSLWRRKRGEHRLEEVRVVRDNGHQVIFVLERAGLAKGGRSQPAPNQQLRQRRDWFLTHYEPASDRDWEAAKIAGAPPTPVVTATPSRPDSTNGHQEVPAYAPLTASLEVDPTVDPEPLPEPPPPPPAPVKKRMKAELITDTKEVDGIVEFWRGDLDVADIARSYNASPSAIYGVLDRKIPYEYRLRRAIDVIKRNDGGPIKQYVISQQCGFNADEVVKILEYGQGLKQLVRWGVHNPARNQWSYFVALPDKVPAEVRAPATPEPTPEPEPVPPPQALPVEAPVVVEEVPETPTIPVEQEEPTPMATTEAPRSVAYAGGVPVSGTKKWKVQVRMGVVEIEVDAATLFAAAHEATNQYPSGEVISVVES